MDTHSQTPISISPNEAARQRAELQLQDVLKSLKDAKRCIRRDWEQLTPRERSAQSRVVKDLEQRQQVLEDEIEMNNAI